MTVRVHVHREVTAVVQGRPERTALWGPGDEPVEYQGATLAAAVRKGAWAILGRPGKAVAPAERLGPDDWRWHWSGGVTLLVHRIRARSGETSVTRPHVQLFARVSPEVDARLDELAETHGTRTKALEAAVMAYKPPKT